MIYLALVLALFVSLLINLILMIKLSYEPKEIIKPTEKEIIDESNGWIDINVEKPPHDVVLACIETYDCGWLINTAWWDITEKRWRIAGNYSEISNLHFTHWRLMPNYKFPKSKYDE